MDGTPTTLSGCDLLAGDPAGDAPREPHLYVVLDAGAPWHAPSRHALNGLAEVSLGRARARSHSRGSARLTLGLPDPRVSTEHARLVQARGTWWLDDLGSKNGTTLDGRAVTGRVALTDFSTIEVGQTLLVFRGAVPTPAGTPLDLAVEPNSAPAPGLETLLPGLAGEFAELARYAATPGALVILGETGTGKDVTARAYHELSRRSGAFVAVNCGALPDALVESSLFGHKRGAFSGATADAPGLVRSADGGTLFLDELGDLPLASQAALLRVIESREVTPVGASLTVRVDVRFVAATHRDVQAMIQRGEFRADLWARLAAQVLVLPPLRARREDLGLLIAASLRRLAPARVETISLHRDAARTLLSRAYPLNTRELVNLLGRAIALEDGDQLPAHSFAAARMGVQSTTEPPGGEGAAGARDEDDLSPMDPSPRARRRRTQLAFLLEEHRGNVSDVARALGKARPLVYKWLKQLGIDPARHRR